MKQTEDKLRSELEEQLRFESLLTEISAHFVNLPTELIDGEIVEAQRRICESIGMDLSSLWQWSNEAANFLSLTHLYSPPEGPHPEEVNAQEVLPWVVAQMEAGKTLTISTENMPPEAALDQETRRHFGVKSSVVLPLSTGGRPIIGVLSFDTLWAERSWSSETVRRLTLIAQVFTNVLERKYAEETMRENEARLVLAADSAEAGLWELDFDTHLFWATERSREIFGYGPEEIINMERFEASLHPDDLEPVRQAITRALDKSEPLNIEYRILVGNESLKWISSRGRPYFKSNGDPDRLMGISCEITGRKQTENELKEKLAEIEDLKVRLENENVYFREEIKMEKGLDKIVGDSDTLKYTLFRAHQVATTDATVLILGETGTGKGLIANAIHNLSPRKDSSMIIVNCASLPANLVESELFGREKGAFTGAHNRQLGRFEIADKGTIFLDEIGELPLELQAKLLRVLQDGEFERLGNPKTVKVDVRVIASTNRDLKAEVLAGRFREDLFYRLNVFPVSLPSLRERHEDIPQLVQFFVDRYNNKFGRDISSIPKATIKMMQDYSWPGNIRELEHVIERSVICSSGDVFQMTERLEPVSVDEKLDTSLNDLATVEREHIMRVLDKTNGRIEGAQGAAAILKLNPSTLRFRIKKLEIKRP